MSGQGSGNWVLALGVMVGLVVGAVGGRAFFLPQAAIVAPSSQRTEWESAEFENLEKPDGSATS